MLSTTIAIGSLGPINSHLARLEFAHRFPHFDRELVPIFQDLLQVAQDYHYLTGSHLHVYGDLSELYDAIRCFGNAAMQMSAVIILGNPADAGDHCESTRLRYNLRAKMTRHVHSAYKRTCCR